MEVTQIKEVITHWNQGEISSSIKVWLSAYASLCYCYFAAKILPKGAARLAAFLPVVALFLLLPLPLHSAHLTGTTGFFIAWLSAFKLLLFAFGKGPLSAPAISLQRFIAIACLPIKLQQKNPPSESQQNGKVHPPKKGQKSVFNYAIKALLFALLLKIYDFEEYIHPRIIMVIYSIHIYLSVELILPVAAALARGLLGVELEPQFDEPYISTSLQNSFGRRWGLMVTRILRPTVYNLVLGWSSLILSRKWALFPAVMSIFIVSVLLQGACLVVGIAVKKAVNGRWRLPRFVGTILIVGFLMVTGFWQFFPQLLQCKAEEKGLAEVTAVGAFVKNVFRALNLTGEA